MSVWDKNSLMEPYRKKKDMLNFNKFPQALTISRVGVFILPIKGHVFNFLKHLIISLYNLAPIFHHSKLLLQLLSILSFHYLALVLMNRNWNMCLLSFRLYTRSLNSNHSSFCRLQGIRFDKNISICRF